MTRSSLGWILVLLVAGVPAAQLASGSTAVVPDDFPSIQAAVDVVPDTVLVRAGEYPERPQTLGEIVLMGHPGNAAEDSVHLAGLAVDDRDDATSGNIIIRRLHLRGPVRVNTIFGTIPNLIEFSECRLDSGLVHDSDFQAVQLFSIHDCVIENGITLNAPDRVMILDNIFLGCGVGVFSGGLVTINDNDFVGPAPGGAIAQTGDYGQTAHRNTIRNYAQDAIYCGGSTSFDISIADNTIESCGRGIIVGGGITVVERNRVFDCDLGIGISGEDNHVVGNTVLRSGSAGIFGQGGGTFRFTSNVVGRSTGAGIRMLSDTNNRATLVRMGNNTSYLNDGPGFLLNLEFASFGDSAFVRNIAYRNGGHGLDFSSETSMLLACNDWFENTLGSTNGITNGGSDLTLDPMFCDVDADSVALSEKSLLLDASGCGLIGALGQGCATTPALVLLFTAEREANGIEVRWRVAEPMRFAQIWVERAETLAGPWARLDGERHDEGDVVALIDRGAANDRDHWYRLVGREDRNAIVLGEAVRVEGSEGSFALFGVGPNPGSGPLRIRFTLAREAAVEMDVFDVQGRHEATLVRGTLPTGEHAIEWSGSSRRRVATSGIHLVRYRYPGGQQMLRFVRLR